MCSTSNPNGNPPPVILQLTPFVLGVSVPPVRAQCSFKRLVPYQPSAVSLNLKMTTRLLFFLLMVALGITTVVPEGSARKNSASRIPNPRDFVRGSSAGDKSVVWKVHLALQLVKHPELSEQQVRIILNAISLSTPEFFTASKGTSTNRTKEDDALESLSQQALSVFPNGQANRLFANRVTGTAEADILKMYYATSALPLDERKASFRNASSRQKSLLWRTHLALFLVKRPELNERQKEVILSAMSLVTPEHYELRPSASAWKTKVRDPLRSLEKQIVGAFSSEDGAKIFATLSDDSESEFRSTTYGCSILQTSKGYMIFNHASQDKWPTNSRSGDQDQDKSKDKKDNDKDKDKGPILEPKLSPCQCSTSSDYCPIWGYCVPGVCNSTSSGCGTFWSYPCNGVCK